LRSCAGCVPIPVPRAAGFYARVMPRPLRDFVPGTIWHLTCRGVDDRDVVVDDDDRRLWIALMRKAASRAGWRLHAWCLMTNHYHLLVSIGLGDTSAALQRLNGVYAREFNRRHERRGHLWEGRFRAWAVDEERHYENTVRYVLENPVRAGLVRRWHDWPWLGGIYVATERAVGTPL
jgi:putative transposase